MLQFDIPRLISDIKKVISIELDAIAKLAEDFMVGEIASLPDRGSDRAVGKPDWRHEVANAIKYVQADTATEIVRNIGVIEQQDENLMFKAMLVEYGMGTKADWGNNPYIQEYLSSEYYDSKRGGQNVYTRPGEYVYNPDSNFFEKSNAQYPSYEIEHFSQQGAFYFYNAMRLIRTDFYKIIEKIEREFDFSKYLVNK